MMSTISDAIYGGRVELTKVSSLLLSSGHQIEIVPGSLEADRMDRVVTFRQLRMNVAHLDRVETTEFEGCIETSHIIGYFQIVGVPEEAHA
jgi:hypothetical protein